MSSHCDRAFILGDFSISSRNRFEANVEMIDKNLSCRLAPFDQQHTIPFDEFAQREITHLGSSIEAIEICMVQNDSSGVIGMHEIERGTRYGFVHAQRFAETLSEDGFPCPHVTFQQDDIVGARQASKSAGDRLRVCYRARPQLQHTVSLPMAD